MIKTGIGFDIHPLVKGRRLILGGVHIKHPFGLAGHSDADALCHALADALLGAIADGDIGEHFPDTNPRWKNSSSLDLLKRVRARLKAAQARALHVDAILMAEAPKIAPYRQAMRRRLARALALPLAGVSIKATTMEGLGALGRGEGIAALAIATVEVAKRTTDVRRRTTEQKSKHPTPNIERPTSNGKGRMTDARRRTTGNGKKQKIIR
ncbi:MAG: 2-C-methyl-D-erythritol 2,4-cyclodiphosphate synthase [Lentisphaerae bacterium]|nr:2-C-methyl-D-erythritol 2,4-cyclodiphosphate synthase [Lentisphaerota bacterium]